MGGEGLAGAQQFEGFQGAIRVSPMETLKTRPVGMDWGQKDWSRLGKKNNRNYRLRSRVLDDCGLQKSRCACITGERVSSNPSAHQTRRSPEAMPRAFCQNLPPTPPPALSFCLTYRRPPSTPRLIAVVSVKRVASGHETMRSGDTACV